MIKIKVCGIRDSKNMTGVADTGPDYLGFIFFPGSKRYVGLNPDPATFHQVPAGILKVGVFVNEVPERILELAHQYALNLVQLHGSETQHDCRVLRSGGIKVIKAFGLSGTFDFKKLTPYQQVCDYFLFDTPSDQHGGTGLKFNWEKIMQYDLEIPFFLSGGIGPNDAGAIMNIQHPAFFAVDINSRFETEPGIKDIQQIRIFIRKIKTIAS